VSRDLKDLKGIPEKQDLKGIQGHKVKLGQLDLREKLDLWGLREK
jgi:hypothetical protein